MKLFYFLTLFGFLFFLLSCDRYSTNASVDITWKRVECFGNETVMGLYINSDNSAMHIVTSDHYGFKSSISSPTDFLTKNYTYSCQYDSLLWLTKYLPSFNDHYCFICNNEGDQIKIYDIENGSWTEVGQLLISDFLPGLPEKKSFAKSHWLNIPNHMVSANDNDYFITTEYENSICKEYRQFLIHLSFNPNMSFEHIYNVLAGYSTVINSEIYSSVFIENRFFQDILFSNKSDIFYLEKKSSEIHFVYNNATIREIVKYNDYLLAVGDGYLLRSFDNGDNWEYFGDFSYPLSITFVNSKLVFYYLNNIGVMYDDFELNNHVTMLDSSLLLGKKIHYLKEFKGYVYAGTNDGLYYIPVTSFFKERPDIKSGIKLNINRM